MRLFFYIVAGLGAAITAATIAYVVASDPEPSAALVFTSAASAVVAVLALMCGRVRGKPRVRTVLAGALVGTTAALALQLFLMLPVAIVYRPADRFLHTFFSPTRAELGFSPSFFFMFLIMVAVFAPLAEEPAKAFAGNLRRPRDRTTAFLAGAAAGAGFAILEHLTYASGASKIPHQWVDMLVFRSLSSPLHPLASGLVVLGVWEWRSRRSWKALVVGLIAGMGVHALWNETVVVSSLVEAGSQDGDLAGWLGPTVLVYTGVLAAVFLLAVWKVSGSVYAGAVGSDPPELPLTGAAPLAVSEAAPAPVRPPARMPIATRAPWLAMAAGLVLPAAVLTIVYHDVF